MNFELIGDASGTNVYQDKATGTVRLFDHEGTDDELSLDLSPDVVALIGACAWRAKPHKTKAGERMPSLQMPCEIRPKVRDGGVVLDGLELRSGRHQQGFHTT